MAASSDATPRLFGLLPLLWRITSQTLRVRIGILFSAMLGAAVVELISLMGFQVYFTFIATRELSSRIPFSETLSTYGLKTQIAVLSVALAVLLLAKVLVVLITNYTLARTVTGYQVTLATRLFRAYQFAPHTWFGARNTSELQRNLSRDVTQISNQIVLPFLQLTLNGIIFGALMVFILITLSPVLLAVMSGIVAVLLVVGFSAQRILVKAGRQARLASGEALKAAYEGINVMTEARVLGRHDSFITRYSRTQGRLGWSLRRQIFLSQSLPVVLESLIMLSFVLIVSFLVVTSDGVEAAFAASAVLAVAIFRLRQVLNKVVAAINRIGAASAALPPIVADLEELEPLSSLVPRRVSAPEEGFSLLRFADAKFAFPDQDRPAIAGITTDVCRGEHLAIMGATGAGKSTFLLLLLGLVNPTDGEISLDGTPLSDVLGEWNAQIGYVPQHVFLTDDTIAANVALGVPENERDTDLLRTALEYAQLWDYVSGLPEGIDSPVGEQGSSLSGGQRQRIGIARALYRSPSVVILDEATSALDRDTQKRVMDAMATLPQNPTIISVTHHLEPLEYADRLIVLEGGHIAADGSVEEVWKLDAFRRVTRTGGEGEA